MDMHDIDDFTNVINDIFFKNLIADPSRPDFDELTSYKFIYFCNL